MNTTIPGSFFYSNDQRNSIFPFNRISTKKEVSEILMFPKYSKKRFNKDC